MPAAPVIKTAPTHWNIPPKEQSGNIELRDRNTARAKGATALWVARPTEPKERELIKILHETCAQMQIPIPKLLIYASSKPNAFSATYTGSLMFGTNLLDIMTHDEVKAIMGHELTHHINRKQDFIHDFIEGSVLLAGYLLIRDQLSKLATKPWVKTTIKIVGDTAAMIGDIALTLWHKRAREYRSDLGGAQVAGTEAMISGLNTLEHRIREIQQQEKHQGKKHRPLPAFLRDHPDNRHRIANLIAHPSSSFANKHQMESAANVSAPAIAR